MEAAIIFSLIILIVAVFRPLRARIAASDSEVAQRFRRLHKPMERVGGTGLVIGALGVLFWREAGIHAAIPVLGAIVFYCSLLTRPDPGNAAQSSWTRPGSRP